MGQYSQYSPRKETSSQWRISAGSDQGNGEHSRRATKQRSACPNFTVHCNDREVQVGNMLVDKTLARQDVSISLCVLWYRGDWSVQRSRRMGRRRHQYHLAFSRHVTPPTFVLPAIKHDLASDCKCVPYTRMQCMSRRCLDACHVYIDTIRIVSKIYVEMRIAISSNDYNDV